MEFSRQEYWSGLPFPLQGIFLTQELNPSLLHCRQILYRLSHQGSLVGRVILDQRPEREEGAWEGDTAASLESPRSSLEAADAGSQQGQVGAGREEGSAAAGGLAGRCQALGVASE